MRQVLGTPTIETQSFNMNFLYPAKLTVQVQNLSQSKTGT